MKKILYILAGVSMLLTTTACNDFLDTSSPSVVDPDLVFSDASTTKRALLGAYADWQIRSNNVHSNGLFYDMAVCGSDSERHAETFVKNTARTIPEALYPDIESFSIDYANAANAWTYMYKIIAVCNNVIASVEATAEYEAFMEKKEPTDLSQIYGEAVALRATAYFELLRYFGDVPHKVKPADDATGFTPRDVIYEYHLNKLIEVEPVMYRVGEGNIDATTMNRTYVQGLIGRYCLFAAGYSTRRTDLGADFYKNLNGETLSFEKFGGEKNNAFYGRRTDYLEFYKTAKTYLAACVANPGTVKLITSDERSGNRAYANPYQRKYQYMNDRVVTPESIYEIVNKQGNGDGGERPYNFGRGSDGGGKNAYPCKTFAQSRFYPTYYYGDFDNKDLRRDVTISVTGSSGAGVEVLTKFINGSKVEGGLMNNKWDENRMANPWTAAQRQSGISVLWMSHSEIILMLAEVYAELGEEGSAKVELAKVRERAFPSAADANVDGFISACGGIKEAIAQERKLEFGGEGYRRWDLIRTGKMPEAVVQLRKDLKAMVDGLETNGYYTFANGNQFSNYVWTKLVDAKTEYGYRLTTQATDENDPVLYPGWRGQNDDWSKYGFTGYSANPKTNLAIKGLFKYIDPNGTEAAQLEADGYQKVAWGANILTAEMKREYTTDPFCGYTDADFAAKNPPLHLCPLSSSILEQDLSLSNGYGFAK